MANLADSRIGVREGYIISVTTLRVESNLAIFLKGPNRPDVQQALDLAQLSLTLTWCTQPLRVSWWQGALVETCIT